MTSFIIDATKAAPNSRPLPKKEIERRDAKFHPTVWGEYFIQYSGTITEPSPAVAKKMEKLKKDVIRELLVDENSEVGLIDWIQRAGISHHFEKEIAKALEHVFQASTNGNTSYKYQSSDLYHIALRFRLLRQQGYHVSTDMIGKFMARGKFNENIKNDIEGLLSLYEASYMSAKGEVILDEALEFAKENLKAALPNLRGSLALQVRFALDLPLHRCTQTLKTRRSISCYESEIRRNEAVLELAKLEFNLQQAMHQKELAQLTRWYKNLDIAGILFFSRDRLVESYFWVLEFLSEPQHSRARIITLKVFIIMTFLDDLYDAYGTFKELEILTLAVERWDMQVLEQSPECFKLVFSILLNVFKDVEDLLNPDELYRIGYLRQVMRAFLKSYFMEAKWFFTQYIPTFKEYMDNAVVSSGYQTLAVATLMGLDSIATEDVFEWAIKFPSIIHFASVIARNRNDIVGHKEEQEKGDTTTGVECYMKEYGCTQEEAYKALQAMVDDAWKQLNYEFLHNSVVPKAILLRVVGLVQVISTTYQNRDSYTDSRFEMKDHINLVLVEPFTL